MHGGGAVQLKYEHEYLWYRIRVVAIFDTVNGNLLSYHPGEATGLSPSRGHVQRTTRSTRGRRINRRNLQT